MRKHLYRAKRADNGQWVYGLLIKQQPPTGAEKWYIAENLNNGKVQGYEIKPETCGEYAGMCDVMNTDIFEGDVIVIEGYPDRGRLQVVFYESSFALATRDQANMIAQGEHPYLNDYARLPELGCMELESFYHIIGNIHDNPDWSFGQV